MTAFSSSFFLPAHRVRRLLFALVASALVAACGEQAQQKAANPLEITRDTFCSLDGMLLADYPGPKAQIHYTQGNPDFFCDTVEMFSVYLQPEQQKRVVALFVQDMGKTSWEAPASNWIDARSAFYVVGSKKRGSMGPTFAAFSEEAAARAFVEKEGGKIVRFAEVKPDMAVLDGGVVKDRSM